MVNTLLSILASNSFILWSYDPKRKKNNYKINFCYPICTLLARKSVTLHWKIDCGLLDTASKRPCECTCSSTKQKKKKKKTQANYHLTSDKEIPVEFACDTTADVICMFFVCGDCCCIRYVPKSTGVIIWCRHNLVMVCSEICEVDSPKKKHKLINKEMGS